MSVWGVTHYRTSPDTDPVTTIACGTRHGRFSVNTTTHLDSVSCDKCRRTTAYRTAIQEGRFTVKVKEYGEDGTSEPVTVRDMQFGDFINAMAFVHQTVAIYLRNDPHREATINPNCSYIYSPIQGSIAGRPMVTITNIQG